MGNLISCKQNIRMSTHESAWRGCAAKFPQPISPEDKQEAQCLVDKVEKVNVEESNLKNIIYRTSEGEKDIKRQVFRWDLAPYNEVFEHGFQVHLKKKTRIIHDKNSYNLFSYVHGGGRRPLDSRTQSSFAFISTTVSNTWVPPVPNEDGQARTVEVYRYEIYAPGGIWTCLSLGDKNDRKVKRLDEVAFVGGIAPQYIRSAQLFNLTSNPDGTTTIERVDNVLQINSNFNPQSHPLRLLNIENPISDYYTNDKKTPLTQTIHHSSSSISNNNNNAKIIEWYANNVANRDIYLSACFRSSQLNEAYYILQNLCTLLNYDPGGTHDHIVNGPSLISKMFKSLEFTPFGEHGVDGAFQLLHGSDEAVLFSSNLCALINYAPITKNDKIIKGPMTIVEMFPFFKNTAFEEGIDGACEFKSAEYEAYVFKGNLCAHIKYDFDNPKLIELGQIGDLIPLLKGTVFEGIGIDAAYASHASNEIAYYFKYNNYGLINVNEDDGVQFLEKVYVMGDNAPVIHSFVPQKNRGIDMREIQGTLLNNPEDYDHDDF